MEKALKKIAIILLILVVCLISFIGIYTKELNKMVNILPEYEKTMDLAEKRIVSFNVDKSTNTVYYDADGNEVESEVEGGKSEEVPINKSDVLTSENYAEVKKILQNRINDLKASEYYLRQDEDGNIVIELQENDMTDLILYTISQTGEFTVQDEESEEVLLQNSDIKEAEVQYSSESDGVSVYLSIQLNEEGTKKLTEISKKYVKTTDEEGNDTTKNIIVKVDDTTLTDTYFGQTIENGMLQIGIGRSSTTTSDLNSYYEQALIYSTVLNNGKLPIVYTAGEYANVVENTASENLVKAMTLSGVIIIAIYIIFIIIIYKVEGIYGGILQIGFVAFLLLIIRYTNCAISIGGLIAIAVITLFQFMFLNELLRERRKYLKTSKSNFNEIFMKYLRLEIPIDIVAIAYTFSSWAPISSFGMILFWGAVLFALYNFVITKALIVESKK